MNLTAEEKLMYSVMKVIYESGIPINFKGSMVLKACLLEAGLVEETRHTVDIDANWNSETEPTAEQIRASLQKAINRIDDDLQVRTIRVHGERRSAGFEIRSIKNDEPLFTMDIDVNRPIPRTKIYEIEGLRFCGVSPSQMIADKMYAISTDAVFRRVKDVVDLFYLSKVFCFDGGSVIDALNHSGRRLENFNGFLQRKEELKHSYEKFRFEGCIDKPNFEEVYGKVRTYIGSMLPRERELKNPEREAEKRERA